MLPKLYDAGWKDEQIFEQHSFTDGRIVPGAKRIRRRKQKRADYRLNVTRDFPIAIVEAKASYETVGEGLQQAKDYAETLDLRFAYATNGHEIIEFDFLTGNERTVDTFPSPHELWSRLRAGRPIASPSVAEQLLTPCFHKPDQKLRYYQGIAINRVVEAILGGQRRILLTMATGTGKTFTAFQICWKLWNARWNRAGAYRRPKILYLADRNILIDDPKDKTFMPFGDARWKITGGKISKGREMYFAIYQAIAEDERRPGLYREYDPDFFDLVIVDECHRGSARDESRWREILDYFEPAYQLGMTATPKRKDNVNTYANFGHPIYTYSLKQGIDDGFLAPYRVHRIITAYDAAGWRPSRGDLDRYGREIPDEEYQTGDFERVVALRARTKCIAKAITDFMARTDRFAKTIVFCVDQEHADEMRRELNNLNSDLVVKHPNYVCRVTADEAAVGRGHLSDFQDVETTSPVILTTSQLLTTGVDAPTCQNVVLARVVNSMVEFKQIIGRGTRLRDDYGKYYFNIAVTHLVYELDPDGNQLRVVKYTDYTAEKVRSLYRNSAELRERWADPDGRSEIIESLAERGIQFDHLAEASHQPHADPFDLLCHIAFNTPIRTRRERADRRGRNARISSIVTAATHVRSLTSCWKNTRSTARRNSKFPPPWNYRRFRLRVTSWRLRTSSEEWRTCEMRSGSFSRFCTQQLRKASHPFNNRHAIRCDHT